MSWPLISDFSRMLQRPRVALRDPRLRSCTVELDALGQPRARSGNFATVYRGIQPDGSEFALRVFNRKADQRRERYQTISQYLRDRNVSCLVGFHYDEQGIRSASDGKLYPLLTMDWVPGVTLFQWARDRCNEGYQSALMIGAQAWLELVRELESHRIVHGDLQHGNVLVSNEGHFKLVDYDCMGVPELFEQPNLEVGLPPYQHPGRDMNTLMFPGLDNFSALYIYVALRALAAAPHLWFKYVEVTGYDKLLFREEDFRQPEQSSLYQELLQSPDPQVRDLAHYLFQLTNYGLRDVPPIDEVLLWCNRLEDLLSARDWDTAVKLLDRMGEHEGIDPALAPRIAEAKRKVALRQELENALAKGNEARARQIHDSGVLADYPAAEQIVEQASHAEQVQSLIKVLESALSLQGWDTFKATWKQHQQLLWHRPSARRLRLEMQKLLTVENLQLQLAKSESPDEPVLQSWEYLMSLGGHVLAEPLRKAVENRRRRQANLALLREAIAAAPDPPTRDSDRRIVAAWHADQMDHWKAIEPERRALEAAKRRLRWLNQTVAASKEHGLEHERRIAGAGEVLPPQYIPNLAPRLRLAQRRVQCLETLARSLDQPVSEAAVLDAWQRLQEAHGQELANEAMVTRMELARSRMPLLQRLQAIPQGLSSSEREQRIADVWEERLLTGCSDAAPWKVAYERVRVFRQRVEQFEKAIAARDEQQLQQLIRLASNVKSRPELAKLIARAKEALQQAALARRTAILNSIIDNQRAAFRELFELATVRDICQQAAHHRPVVARWLEQDILPLERLGMRVGEGEGLEKLEDGRWRARWTWPAAAICAECRLQVCGNLPKPYTIPEDAPAVHRCVVPRSQWTRDGYVFVVEPEWDGYWVLTWAVIELGFQTFFSPALTIGRLQLTEKSRRWGIFGGR